MPFKALRKGWHLGQAVVKGTSHEKSGTSCQDFCMSGFRNDTLIVVASDGAGSAKHSDVGARLACKNALSIISKNAKLLNNVDNEQSWRQLVLKAMYRARHSLRKRAQLSPNVTLRDFAATLQIVIATEKLTIVAQIGDGLVIGGFSNSVDDTISFQRLFTPQRGEYANSTVFLTSPRAVETSYPLIFRERLQYLCVMSDGVVRVTATMPFLRPLERFHEYWFQNLPKDYDQNSVIRNFLEEKVRSKSDDDLTLFIACRTSSCVSRK